MERWLSATVVARAACSEEFALRRNGGAAHVLHDAEMSQDLVDNGWVLDECDDATAFTTARAVEYVDVEHAL